MATSDQILSRILVRCGWPSTNAPLTSAEILTLCDDEITSTLWPLLHKAQGDWHLATLDHAITAGQALYRLPARSWGGLIKDALYYDSSGELQSLSIVNVEELGRLGANAPGGQRYVGYVDGDAFGLHPQPTSSIGALRIRHYRYPNTLCLTSEARQITGLPTSSTLTLASTISGWTSSSEVDVIGEGGSHQIQAEELGVTSVVSTTLTLDAAYPSNVAIGDWVSLTGTTPVAPIPDHLIPMLVSRVSALCLSSHGDNDGFRRATALSADLESRVMPTLDPRNEAEPRIIIGRSSPLRRGWR